MQNFQSKLETSANIAIVVVALLIIGLFVQRTFFSDPQQPAKSETRPTPVLGTKVNLPGVDWTQASQTVLFVLQKGCRYCTESAPFYQKLVKAASGKDVKFLVIVPLSKKAGDEYLNELGISGVEFKQATLASLQVG